MQSVIIPQSQKVQALWQSRNIDVHFSRPSTPQYWATVDVKNLEIGSFKVLIRYQNGQFFPCQIGY